MAETRGRVPDWTAVEQSEVAAQRLLVGRDAELEPLAQVPYVWTDQFELRLAIAGEVPQDGEMHVCHGSLEEGRFLVLFGSGLAFAEYGSSMIGILLIIAGYGTFSAQSILKIVKKLTR